MICNSIFTYRKQLNLSQSDLARLLHVSRNTVSSWERGEFLPSLEAAFGLSRIFAVPIEKIFYVQLKIDLQGTSPRTGAVAQEIMNL